MNANSENETTPIDVRIDGRMNRHDAFATRNTYAVRTPIRAGEKLSFVQTHGLTVTVAERLLWMSRIYLCPDTYAYCSCSRTPIRAGEDLSFVQTHV
jgi:hypothetical protein